MENYKEKADEAVDYMQKVQQLLSQLTSYFAELDEIKSTTSSSTTLQSLSLLNSNHESTKPVSTCPTDDNGLTNKITDGYRPKTTVTKIRSSCNNNDDRQHGRALLKELSESVATAVSRTKQATLPRNLYSGDASHASKPSTALPPPFDDSDQLDNYIRNCPPMCWQANHVRHWLGSEHVNLPGGCLDAALRQGNELDGPRLINSSLEQLAKLLLLTDSGLKTKLRLALQDLRIYGQPGRSRQPGPSHITTDWLCRIWLPNHLGLLHLTPLFSHRRIDGRLLAFIASSSSLFSSTKAAKSNSRRWPSKLSKATNTTRSMVIRVCDNPQLLGNQCSTDLVVNPDVDLSTARCKELRKLLLGSNGSLLDNGQSLATSSTPFARSGAECTTRFKTCLKKTELRSLLSGIELLRRYDFDTEKLNNARKESCHALTSSSLALWTNELVADWLSSIGLSDFIPGINGSGIHGAFMAFDHTFTVEYLIKLLHIPSHLAASCGLKEQFDLFVRPFRPKEAGPSENGLFRRRSTCHSFNPNAIMKRSSTSSHSQHSVDSPEHSDSFDDQSISKRSQTQPRKSTGLFSRIMTTFPRLSIHKKDCESNEKASSSHSTSHYSTLPSKKTAYTIPRDPRKSYLTRTEEEPVPKAVTHDEVRRVPLYSDGRIPIRKFDNGRTMRSLKTIDIPIERHQRPSTSKYNPDGHSIVTPEDTDQESSSSDDESCSGSFTLESPNSSK